MKHKLLQTLVLTFILAILAEIGYTSVNKITSSGGQSSRTQKTPSTQGCTCHGGSATPNLVTTLSGPSAMPIDSAANFTFTLGSGGPGVQGGFNVSVSNDLLGFLVPVSSGVSYNSTDKEIIHSSPKSYSSGSTNWDFKFVSTATSAANVTLYGVGLSGNGSGTSGDNWNFTSKTIALNPSFPSGTAFVPNNNAWDLKDNKPLNQSNAYDKFATIYTNSEIAFGRITRIGFFIGTESSSGGGIFRIYMKETANTSFASATTAGSEISGATQVYLGAPAYNASNGWFMFDLSTPFDYTANNLEIIIANEKGFVSNDDKQTLNRFTSSPRSQYWSGNSNVIVGNPYSIQPNIRVETITDPSTLNYGTLTASSVALSWTAATKGQGYRIVYKNGSSITSPTDGAWADIVGNNNTNYTVTGLPSGRYYSFKVYTKTGNLFSVNGSNIVSTFNSTYASGTFVNEQSGNFIYGQPSFEAEGLANAGGLSAASLNNPTSVFVDTSSVYPTEGIKYVTDQFNNRLLIYKTTTTSDGSSANIVIGQPDFTTNTAPVTPNAGSLNYPSAVFVYGTKMIVADRDNNRVLIWNTIPTNNGTAADIVLGQANFTSKNPNRGLAVSANGFNSPEAIFVYNNKLLVADGNNNRVLIWNNINTLVNGQAADVVIGQVNKTSNASPNTNASTSATLYYPKALAVANNGKLLIASRLEHRVLIYNTIPTSDGASANLVLGQANNTDNQFSFSSTTDSTFGFLRGIAVSPNNNRVALSEAGNSRIVIWNTFPTQNNQKPNIVIGRPSLTASTSSTFSNQTPSGLNASVVAFPELMYWAKTGDLYVAMAARNGVIRYQNGDVSLIGPNVLNATPTNNSIQLNWSGGNSTKYKLVYKLGEYPPIDTTDGIAIDNLTGTSTTINNLACNNMYSFRIWGKNNANQYASNPSPAASVTSITQTGATCANLPLANSSITSVAVYGTTAYITGYFSQINGQTRNGIAAYNVNTNALLPWNPSLTFDGASAGFANCIKVTNDGNHVIVGGFFNFVGTNADTNLAKISTSTGLSVNYPNAENGAVDNMAIANDNSIYCYGQFTGLTGFATANLGAINGNGTVKTSFNPLMATTNLRAIHVNESNTRVYIGHGNGSTTYNGNTRAAFAELDATTGATTSFAPFTSSGIFSFATKGNSLWMGGSFDKIENAPSTGANTPRRGIAKFTYNGSNWILDNTFNTNNISNSPNGDQNFGTVGASIRGIHLFQNKLFVMGAEMISFGNEPRYGVAAIDTGNASLVTSYNLGTSSIPAGTNFRMDASNTLQKIFFVDGSAAPTGKHIAGVPILSNLTSIPFSSPNVKSVNKMINSNGVFDFTPATAMDINFSGNTMTGDSGIITVDYFGYGNNAFHANSILETNKSTYRWIVNKPWSSNFNAPYFTSAEIRIDLDEIPGRGGISIGQESSVKIYKRSLPDNTKSIYDFENIGPVTYDNVTHELRVSVTSFGEFILASNSAALPVELINFTAKAMDEKNVQLYWSTAQETNNQHFEIERSNNGIHFIKIGNSAGAGNSLKINQYTFHDQIDLKENKVLYYRLKQVDFNGNSTWSKIETVNYNTDNWNDLAIFPNPTSENLYFNRPLEEGTKIEVLDIRGTSIMKESCTNSIHTFNTEWLNAGIYFIKIENQHIQQSFKFIKQ